MSLNTSYIIACGCPKWECNIGLMDQVKSYLLTQVRILRSQSVYFKEFRIILHICLLTHTYFKHIYLTRI